VLYTGETGVGKSVVVQAFLDKSTSGGDGGGFVSYTMGYSAQTKPKNLKEVLETKLEKKRKNLLGPPSGKRMLFFIDDLNMPALEVYGAQPPNELLRQIIDSGGFYDTQKLFFKYVKDVVSPKSPLLLHLIRHPLTPHEPSASDHTTPHHTTTVPQVFASCCAPPGGGRNLVSPRLLRQFHLVWLTNLSGESMTRIFSSILRGFLSIEIPALAKFAEPIVKASVGIYERSASPRPQTHIRHTCHPFAHSLACSVCSSMSQGGGGAAADACQVALHLQPARSVEGLPGRAHDPGSVHVHSGGPGEALVPRGVPRLPRPPHQ
jgi:dynein heavy chain